MANASCAEYSDRLERSQAKWPAPCFGKRDALAVPASSFMTQEAAEGYTANADARKRADISTVRRGFGRKSGPETRPLWSTSRSAPRSAFAACGQVATQGAFCPSNDPVYACRNRLPLAEHRHAPACSHAQGCCRELKRCSPASMGARWARESDPLRTCYAQLCTLRAAATLGAATDVVHTPE